MNPALHRLAVTAAFVAFCVIVLGAYVRLSHAGLGCPDWPGCYGQLTWPVEAREVIEANQTFPERQVDITKAWKEMVHRYLAGTLVLLVLVINYFAWRSPDGSRDFRPISAILLSLILFQAVLGMWTVTLKLWPIVVMGHLMGGLATFALLLLLIFRSGENGSRDNDKSDRRRGNQAYIILRPWIATGLIVLIVQLALGGWTSANYAALACPDFPKCQGEIWPSANFRDGFVLLREIGVDYEGGVLDLSSRVAIHMAHRLGALLTLLVLGLLTLRLVRRPPTRRDGMLLGALLLAQISLGILNVLLFLPLPNAVAHNGVGALLFAMMIWLFYRSANSKS